MPKAAGKKSASYEKYKAQQAAHNAADSLEGRDIGLPHPPVNPERRRKAKFDFNFFCRTYFARTFYLEWSPDHLRVIDKIEQAVLFGGLFAMAMPRGSGKSAMAEIACLWAELNGHHNFVALIGATEEHAQEMLESMTTEIESNDLLSEDYNEVTMPIEALEGIANRCNGQLCNGERTHITWTGKVCVLPTIKLPDTPEWKEWRAADGFSLASGGIIKVAGLTGRLRGMKFKRRDGKTVRPKLVVLDDPQTDQSAKSLSQCKTRERILAGAVLGLSGPGEKISGIMPCTVIRAGDMADEILNRDKHPEWSGERTKMVYKFPTNEKLWEQYAQVRADGLRAEQGLKPATDFYIANQWELEEGAEVAWPARFNPDEASALQHAMNLKLQNNEAFFAEYQNDPIPELEPDDGLLSVDDIARKLNGLNRATLSIDCSHVTMFIDIQAKLLFYTVVAFNDDFTGYVIDYGAFPDQKRNRFTLREAQQTLQLLTPAAGIEGQIYAGLEALTAAYLTREWRRDDGAAMKIERCLIDANWGDSTDVVYQFCRQSVHASILLPSHGRYVGASSVPFADYKRKQGDRVGHNWRVPTVQGKRAIRHVLFDTNFWKSFIHSRLAVAMGDRGSLSLWGRDPHAHELFAEHLTAEHRIRTEGRGRVVHEWKLRPNAIDNHWLDCVVGCTVAASMVGCALAESSGSGAPKEKQKKVSLAELQRQRRAEREKAGMAKGD